MKKISLLPLATMILCSIVSLSSGLKYETRSVFFFVPVFFVLAMYFFMQYMIFMEDERRKRRFCFLVTTGVSTFFSLLFWRFILLGLENIAYRILDNANAGYSLRLVVNEMGQEEYVALSLFFITGVIMIFSLWMFEKNEPLWITALPSFVLFCLPLMADGAPAEWCIVGYGVSFAIFLIVGKSGNVKQLITACALIGILLGMVIFGNSWMWLKPHVTAYRNYIHTKFNLPSSSVAEGPIQKIEFGKYDESGSIEYSGLTAMNIYSRVDLRHSLIYLRGYVGSWYDNNIWVGVKQKIADPMGLALRQANLVEMRQVADKGIYYCYVMDQELPERYQKKKIDYSEEVFKEISADDLQITKKLEKQIKQEVVGEKKPKTIGDAMKRIRKYLKKNCRYTLSPGKVEQSGELEAFLFERKTGYCTHYATAAVMMFRTMKIPARLAQGYMIPGDQILLAEWTPVMDQNAHAWLEIYIPNVGWYPVDATAFAVALPGQTLPFDVETFRKQDNDKRQNSGQDSIAQLQETDVMVTPSPTPELDSGKQKNADKKQNISAEQLQRKIVLCVLVLVIAMGSVCVTTRLVKGVKYKKSDKHKMKAYRQESDLTKKFLLAQEMWEPYLEKIGILCNYRNQHSMISNFEKGLGMYISAEKISEFRLETEFYVNCCYLYRYGKEEITAEKYDRCKAYLYTVFEALSHNEDQKGWKKMRKCCIVDEVMNKKKKDR